MKTTTFCFLLIAAGSLYAQPNPYQPLEKWAQLPEGRKWGSASAIDIDRRTGHIWVADRCGANTCSNSKDNPIFEFDESGKLLKNFGAGVFVTPHGMYVDKDGNLWMTDQVARDGKGNQVLKFSPDGKILMTLGKAGVTGTGPDTFNQPSDVIVAPNGDIFVADGHGGDTNARIVKFSSDGKFIKTWGKKGSGPGEFDTPHALAFDAKGRLFVGDRGNRRIQIFDQDGKFLEEWKQFGGPSGIYIDPKGNIYTADSQSNAKNNPGYKRGIRVGTVKDGKVKAFIPDPMPTPESDDRWANSSALPLSDTSAAEGVVADAKGNIYGAEVGPQKLTKYVPAKH
jgi:DNA-binding beta-propeller fold protein YncE